MGQGCRIDGVAVSSLIVGKSLAKCDAGGKVAKANALIRGYTKSVVGSGHLAASTLWSLHEICCP
jgi:hypothetical protein